MDLSVTHVFGVIVFCLHFFVRHEMRTVSTWLPLFCFSAVHWIEIFQPLTCKLTLPLSMAMIILLTLAAYAVLSGSL